MRFPMAVVALSVLAFPALAATSPQLRDFKGTWTCSVCDAKHFKGNAAECEALSHNHWLKLSDGTCVSFLETPRSETLIAGGGRQEMPLEVCGFYDPQTHTLDVLAFRIDNVWSSWSDTEHRMVDHAAQAEVQASNLSGSSVH